MTKQKIQRLHKPQSLLLSFLNHVLYKSNQKNYFRLLIESMRSLLCCLLICLLLSCRETASTAKNATPAASRAESSPAAVMATAAQPFTTTMACTFAAIAYCSNPQQQADKHLPGWEVIWHAPSYRGNHAFVAHRDGIYVIAIRGSLMEISWDAFDNWIYQDLNIVEQVAWPHTGKGSKLSRGSYRGWANLDTMTDSLTNEKLSDFLLKVTTEKTPVIFTGHSLGGNLATVYATFFHALCRKNNRKTDQLNVITFAAPAAGNEVFAKDFDTYFPTSVRVENKLDMVPKFPCTDKVAALGSLFPTMAASKINVGYKSITTSLTNVFKTISTAMTVLELKNGMSSFRQTNTGNVILLGDKLSGNNNSTDIQSWFGEAGYQHGIAQYAALLGAPVIDCN